MPRRARAIEGGYVYHVLNRSNGRITLFRKPADYEAFLQVLEEAQARVPLRVLAYCVLSNHWHFLVWPEPGRAQDVSEFFRWLTVTHTQRWHAHHGTSGTGHLYQGRFKSFPVEDDEHFYTVARYVERNALRANLVAQAEDWQFGSLWAYYRDPQRRRLLSRWPVPRPTAWLKLVNQPQTEAEIEAVRTSIQRSRPFWRRGLDDGNHRQAGVGVDRSSARSPAPLLEKTPVPFSMRPSSSLSSPCDRPWLFHLPGELSCRRRD